MASAELFELRDPFTAAEHEVLRLLGAAFNAFSELPKLHPADMPEFIHYTHALQNMVIQRPGARALYGVAKPVESSTAVDRALAILPCTARADGLHDFRNEVCDCGASRDDTLAEYRQADEGRNSSPALNRTPGP